VALPGFNSLALYGFASVIADIAGRSAYAEDIADVYACFDDDTRTV
jgi:hypothetical protein